MSGLPNAPFDSITFPTDYPSILQRIDSIDPMQYAKTRNFTDGAVTYLSPYISRGVISVKRVRDAVLSKGFSPASIQKFLQELAWREYFQRVWQVQGEGIFTDLHRRQDDVIHYAMLRGVVDASTCIDAIDQSIHQLYNVGYIHNHVRMYIASIATNIAKAHWLTPSRWMYANLLDGDLASNMCSWQWVAGTFSTKKYFCNQDNINYFTKSEQKNTFLDHPIESLVGHKIPSSLREMCSYELPSALPMRAPVQIDVTKPTLIYNSYNLDPEWRKSDDANRVLLLEPSHFKKYPVTENVMRFILSLGENIPNLQVLVGETDELKKLYVNAGNPPHFISKEHPAFRYYPGTKDDREWIYQNAPSNLQSFSAFWKSCTRVK